MDINTSFKGKGVSASTPSFAIRYNAEEEEVEQFYSVSEQPSDSLNKEEVSRSSPALNLDSGGAKDLPKSGKRSGSEDGRSTSPEPWRIFTEIKGRITKTVEEKIEEIKSDRIRSKNKKKQARLLQHNSSLSDSEERSETSVSSVKDNSEGGFGDGHRTGTTSAVGGACVADSDLGDESDVSLTPERATTPMPCGGYMEVSREEAATQTTGSPIVARRTGAAPLHRKTKTRSVPKKVELGIEAVEELRGREEGSITTPGGYGRNYSVQTGNVDATSPSFVPQSVRIAVYFAFLALFYSFLNQSQFLFGVVVGVFLSLEFGFFSESCFQWLCGLNGMSSRRDSHLNEGLSYLNSPLPRHKEVVSFIRGASPTANHEGWMNEFCSEYQPEIYNVRQTDTVFVRLGGSLLTLATPRQKIPKRAFWNEPKYKVRFDRERTYDITNCKVTLLPDKLAHKRIWSKKYPICIILNADSHLGTRYREKSSSTLDVVSFLKSGLSKNSEGDQKDSPELKRKSDIFTKKEQIAEFKNTVGGNESPEDEGEVTFYSYDEDEDEEEEDGGCGGDYVKVSSSLVNKNSLYLFARTDREKDIWFRRLVEASKSSSSSSTLLSVDNMSRNDSTTPVDEITAREPEVSSKGDSPTRKESSRDKDNREETSGKKEKEESSKKDKEEGKNRQTDKEETESKKEINYEHYVQFVSRLGKKTFIVDTEDSDEYISLSPEDEGLVWFNTLLGRMVYDAMHDPYWIGQIQEKLQRKMSVIKVPQFMEEVVVSQVEVSDTVPVIEQSHLPKITHDGIWVDLEMTYSGTFKMTMETKINLIKLKNYGAMAGKPQSGAAVGGGDAVEGAAATTSSEPPSHTSPERLPTNRAIFDSEAEDSAESSCEEVDPEESSAGRSNTSQKVMQMVDKIAASKYFQQVTDNKYIKKALEGVSNTRISLVVEVKSLSGTVVLNFPPPPSDRLWYGFRPNTKLIVSARPKVGQHGINMTYIVNFLEKMIYKEFEKLLVMPNMDDLIIPIMTKAKPS